MSELPKGTILHEKYELLGKIGEGAFGIVYRARDLSLGRTVAIKLFRRSEADGALTFDGNKERFKREAKVQAGYKHPHIAHVYELLENPKEGTLALVMEEIEGSSLKAYLEKRGKLPSEEAVRLIGQLLTALEAVHNDRRDVVHRDIKPSNILLTQEAKPQVKLSDFGLAQIADESSVSRKSGATHPGTPTYMPPEQESSYRYLDGRSDLYAVGCVLFEMLTGEVYKAVRRKKLFAQLWAEVPPSLQAVLSKAWADEPDDRYEDAEAMREAIQGGGVAASHAQAAREAAARQQAEQEAWARAEQEAQKAQQALSQQLEEERDARKKAEQAREALARRLAEQEAKDKAEREARARAEQEAKAKEEAKVKAEREAQARAVAVPGKVSLPHVVTGPAPLKMAWCWVPGGPFTMGSEQYDDEKPAHQVEVAGFWLGRYAVTNGQYKLFVEAGGYREKRWWIEAGWAEKAKGWAWQGSNWAETGQPWQEPNWWRDEKWNGASQPVVGVSWYEARAFCAWASEATGERVRLPTEAEWEKGARGTDGRVYPWGNAEPTEKLCNFDRKVGKTTPVGAYSPQGDSPYGCAEMAGNVWEWVQSKYVAYPYREGDGRNDENGTDDRALRGGSWLNNSHSFRVAYRNDDPPSNRLDYFGFRVCCSSPIS